MIPSKIRESRRVRGLKLPKNLDRLYKEGKCRECTVVVTRMDFAKILGKFTKVKIQYESSTTSKTKKNSVNASVNSNARLKSKENGMVQIRRSAYNEHPVKDLTSSKKAKNELIKNESNVLKENNKLKKSVAKTRFSMNGNQNSLQRQSGNNIISTTNPKQYVIVFEEPVPHYNNDLHCKISLPDLLSHINESILPSADWCIDFFPKRGEPKDDKVYDRIAAELEDLMYSEKSDKSNDKTETVETKVDDFPSIMDILNDNSSENKSNDQSSSLEFKSNLESSDVEAMLLGKPSAPTNTMTDPTPAPMEIDNPGVLIGDENQFAETPENINPQPSTIPSVEINEEVENPQSPSILDEALQKGIEEHLPCHPDKPAEVSEENTGAKEEKSSSIIEKQDVDIKIMDTVVDQTVTVSPTTKPKETISLASIEGITHLVFKQTKDGTCFKSVTCPKNLKYDIEIDGKSVEFLGAPKLISNSDDLQVLLEIVNESDLSNKYVSH